MFAYSSQPLRAAIAMAIVACAAACSTPDTRTNAERAADRALANKVVLALLDGRYLDADHIQVEARRGAVRLSGKVASDSDLREALRIAAAVPGVRRVVNQIDVMAH